ncbi:Uncharacterised protein [Bordetella pertussis]|nr:Uncharacterised protein [Bordetella pertussis]
MRRYQPFYREVFADRGRIRLDRPDQALVDGPVQQVGRIG